MPLITYNDQPLPKRFKLTTYIVAAIVLICIVFANLSSTYVAEPRLVSKAFVADIEAKKLDQAYHLSGKQIQHKDTETSFIKAITANESLVDGSTKEVNHGIAFPAGGGVHPVFIYSVKAKETIYFRIELDKENGIWKVIHFEASAERPEATIF